MEIETVVLDNGFIKLEVLNLGAVIYRCEVKDGDGQFANVVVGFADKADYLDDSGPSFNAVVGRVAGRIRGGHFVLDGVDYPLQKNAHENTLHGGRPNYGYRFWTIVERNETMVKLQLRDEALTHGFPGTVLNIVTYQLIENRLVVTYQAGSDEDTPWDLTQHAYWNLSGDLARDIQNHSLQINADRYNPLDEKGMVKDELADVQDTPFDLRTPCVLAEQFTALYGGYDHPFLLNTDMPAATLIDLQSRRKLQVFTDKPALVCYTPLNLPEKFALLHDGGNHNWLAVCLETQFIPNAIQRHEAEVEIPLLKKNEPQQSQTIFVFSTL